MLSFLGAGLSWLFGNSKAADKTLDAVIATGDSLVFTTEEKSAANQKVLDATISYMHNTQAQSISRRIIASAVTFAWLVLLLVACVFAYFDRTDESYSMFLFEVLKDIVADPFKIIVAFYFLSQLGAAASGAIKRLQR